MDPMIHFIFERKGKMMKGWFKKNCSSSVFLGLALTTGSFIYAQAPSTPCSDCLPRFNINEFIEQNSQKVCTAEDNFRSIQLKIEGISDNDSTSVSIWK